MNQQGSFDVTSLAPTSDTAEVTIFDPRTRKDTDIVITVCGRDSARYKEVIRRQLNRRTKHLGRRLALTLSAEEVEQEALDLLVECTVSWRNVVMNGSELTCTPANVRLLYQTVPIIREQVDEAIADRTLFLPR